MQIPRASDSGVKHVRQWACHVIQKAAPRPGPIKASPAPSVNTDVGLAAAKSGLFVKGRGWVC